MCVLCNDETAYAAFMEYIDAQERAGKEPDIDKAMDAVIEKLQAEAAKPKKNASPFQCDPVDE